MTPMMKRVMRWIITFGALALIGAVLILFMAAARAAYA